MTQNWQASWSRLGAHYCVDDDCKQRAHCGPMRPVVVRNRGNVARHTAYLYGVDSGAQDPFPLRLCGTPALACARIGSSSYMSDLGISISTISLANGDAG